MKKAIPIIICALSFAASVSSGLGCASGDGALVGANAVDLDGQALAIETIDRSVTADGITSHVRAGGHVYVVSASVAGDDLRVTCERDDGKESLNASSHARELQLASVRDATYASTKMRAETGAEDSLDRLRARLAGAPALAGSMKTLARTLPISEHVARDWKGLGLDGRFAALLDASSEALTHWEPSDPVRPAELALPPRGGGGPTCSGGGSTCSCCSSCSCTASPNGCSCTGGAP